MLGARLATPMCMDACRFLRRKGHAAQSFVVDVVHIGFLSDHPSFILFFAFFSLSLSLSFSLNLRVSTPSFSSAS